jgi:hypothetical protein
MDRKRIRVRQLKGKYVEQLPLFSPPNPPKGGLEE